MAEGLDAPKATIFLAYREPWYSITMLKASRYVSGSQKVPHSCHRPDASFRGSFAWGSFGRAAISPAPHGLSLGHSQHPSTVPH